MGFVGAAAGNIDTENTGFDTWYVGDGVVITTGSTCSDAASAPAGVPANTFSDVECD
jgi:hypothetical protein